MIYLSHTLSICKTRTNHNHIFYKHKFPYFKTLINTGKSINTVAKVQII